MFFFRAYMTYTKIDHILHHKTSLNKFLTIEIIQNVFSDPNEIKLEINSRQLTEISKYLETKQHTCKQSMGQRGSFKGKKEKCVKLNENENTTYHAKNRHIVQ